MKLPRFIPILTAFTSRVSGRDLNELLRSPAALARALVDTQKVVGHDGILAIYHPSLLAASCLGRQRPADGETPVADAASLIPAAEVPRAGAMAAVFESIGAVRHRLPEGVQVFAAFAGPALLHSQLKEVLRQSGDNVWDDTDYVSEVVLATVRASFEVAADGVALIERLAPAMPAELLRVYRKVRKQAEFYNGSFLLFEEAGSSSPDASLPAHCRLDLSSATTGSGVVTGQLDPSGVAREATVVTTAGDVPADTPVSVLAALMQQQPAA